MPLSLSLSLCYVILIIICNTEELSLAGRELEGFDVSVDVAFQDAVVWFDMDILTRLQPFFEKKDADKTAHHTIEEKKKGRPQPTSPTNIADSLAKISVEPLSKKSTTKQVKKEREILSFLRKFLTPYLPKRC